VVRDKLERRIPFHKIHSLLVLTGINNADGLGAVVSTFQKPSTVFDRQWTYYCRMKKSMRAKVWVTNRHIALGLYTCKVIFWSMH
jgi:hypothetical protein